MKKLLKVFGTVLIIIVSVFAYNLNTTNAQVLSAPVFCPVGYLCVPTNQIQTPITIKSPNGGESYILNSSQILVKWVSNYESKNVKVKLYTASGVEKFSSTYLESKIGENIYTIPKNGADIAGSYTVKVCDDSKSPVGLPSSILCDSSDGVFKVSKSADILDYPVINKAQSLAGNENVLYSGENFSIQGENLQAFADGGFDIIGGNTSVYIDGIGAKITQINHNLISVTAPKLLSGYYSLHVKNEDGVSNTVIINVITRDTAGDIRCPVGYTCNFINDGSTQTPPINNFCYKFNTNLSVGTSNGNDVMALQKFLIALGYSNLTISGVFDQNTKNAVIEFQKNLNIPTTGFVGPLTRAAIHTTCSVPAYVSSAYSEISSGSSNSSTAVVQITSHGDGQSVYMEKRINDGTYLAQVDFSAYTNITGTYSAKWIFKDVSGKFGTQTSSDIRYTSGNNIQALQALNGPATYSVTLEVTDSNGKLTISNPITLHVKSRDEKSITVISPNGNESLVEGSVHTISWTSRGSNATEYVEIDLLRKSPRDTQFWNIGTIAKKLPGTGSYVWKVSAKDEVNSEIINGSEYKILVGRDLYSGRGQVDQSDFGFKIINTGQANNSNSSNNPSYCYTFSKDLSIETAAQGVPVSTTEGVSIFNLQTLLVDKEKINVDSNERNVKTPIFNASTRQAVIAFQKKYGINPTGYVGPVTRAKLNALYGCNNGINQSPLQTNIPQVITTPQQIISVPEAQQVQKYYQNTTVSNVRLTQYNNDSRVRAGSVLQKGQKYTIDWDASSVPESARFTIIVQSPTNPTIYGVIKTGLLGPTKRSFDWTIDTPFIENTDLQIIVQTNDVKASSPIFKVASTPVPVATPYPTPTPSPSPVVSVPSIKSISPSSGLPGTKVTLTLSNPKKVVLSEGDFAFGQYSFTNFTNSNNEVVTFTIPSDAKAGVYDVVWFGDDVYSTKFTVTYPSNTSSAIDWYYPIFGSKSR